MTRNSSISVLSDILSVLEYQVLVCLRRIEGRCPGGEIPYSSSLSSFGPKKTLLVPAELHQGPQPQFDNVVAFLLWGQAGWLPHHRALLTPERNKYPREYYSFLSCMPVYNGLIYK